MSTKQARKKAKGKGKKGEGSDASGASSVAGSAASVIQVDSDSDVESKEEEEFKASASVVEEPGQSTSSSSSTTASLPLPTCLYPLIVLAYDEQERLEFGVQSVHKPVVDRESIHRLCQSFHPESVQGVHSHSSIHSSVIHFDKLDFKPAEGGGKGALAFHGSKLNQLGVPQHVQVIGLFGTELDIVQSLQKWGGASDEGQTRTGIQQQQR